MGARAGVLARLFATSDQWQEAVNSWEGIGDAPAERYRSQRRGFRVLENDFLEKYVATAHWSLPGLWSIPLVLYCLYRAVFVAGEEPSTIVALFLAGMLGWTFFEYWLHRWIFHLPPSRISFIRNIQFTLHGYHHEFPEDPGRLVAPPVMAFPIAGMLTAAVVFSFPGNWPSILAGTFFGYLCYDWVHYFSHHGRTRWAWGKFQRRFHMEHHYKNARTQFGLSSPLWDVVFLTFRRPRSGALAQQEREKLAQSSPPLVE